MDTFPKYALAECERRWRVDPQAVGSVASRYPRAVDERGSTVASRRGSDGRSLVTLASVDNRGAFRGPPHRRDLNPRG